MGINVASSFTRNAPVAIDDRFTVADLTARDAIDAGVRYEGMFVYVVSEGANYQLVGGVDNANWEDFGSGGGGGGSSIILKENDLTTSPSKISSLPFEKWNFSGNNEKLWFTLPCQSSYEEGEDIAVDGIKVMVDSTDTSKNVAIEFDVYLFKNFSAVSSMNDADATQTVTAIIPIQTIANIILNASKVLAASGLVDSTTVEATDVLVVSVGINKSYDGNTYQGDVILLDGTMTPRFKGI